MRQLAVVNPRPLGNMQNTGGTAAAVPYLRRPVVPPKPVPTVPLAQTIPAPSSNVLSVGGVTVNVSSAPGGGQVLSFGGPGGILAGLSINLPAGVDPSAILAAIVGALGGGAGGGSCGC